MKHALRTRLGSALCVLLLLASSGCATSPPSRNDDGAADRAARAWLTLVDSGAYERSWQQASTLFKSGVDQAAWVEAIGRARADTGAPQERNLISVAYTHKLPGAPENDYVVLIYASQFDSSRTIQETLTLVREDDRLKAAGYFIR